MKTIEKGKFVKVHYTGKFEDEQIFDSSHGCNPMEVQIGENQVIAGFENALLGMAENEKKTFTLLPEEAYGVRDESSRQTVPRLDLPSELDPQVGQIFAIKDKKKGQVRATVMQVDDKNVIMDMNHPLAGKTLNFEIEVLEINDLRSQTPSQCNSGCSCG